MAAAKFKQTFDLMLKSHQELFDRFKVIHDHYLQNPKQYQQEFNEVGRDAQDIIRRYENILCSRSEGTGYGKYSTNLAEKFQAEVKKAFPKIDFVGEEQ